jgi:hypothetical protein
MVCFYSSIRSRYISGDDGFIEQVKGYIYLPTKKEFYSPGKSNKAIFGNVDLTFRMLASVLKAWKNTCIKIKHF